jgi:hypothetical protein
MPEEFKKVDSSSSVYKEFARLYRVVRDLRASSVDRWNGEAASQVLPVESDRPPPEAVGLAPALRDAKRATAHVGRREAPQHLQTCRRRPIRRPASHRQPHPQPRALTPKLVCAEQLKHSSQLAPSKGD